MSPTQSTPPPLAPVPGATLLSATDFEEDLDLDWEGTMEQDELLGGAPTAPSPPPAPTQPHPQQRIRWDRIVTAGLGVMALTSLLFVATDSFSLLCFTPPPTDAATRVRTGASARPSSYYTTLSYKDEGTATQKRRGGPLPPCNYTLLNADPWGIAWNTAAGAKQLSPIHAACRVRTFEGADGHVQAVKCLQGKHLLFVGDSLSRYQYLGLVNFLETGSWHEKPTTTTTRDGTWQSIWKKRQEDHVEVDRSIMYASGWGQDWNDFSRLTAESLGGHEVVDCFRDGHVPWVENRYYHLPPSSLPSRGVVDRGGGVRVSFLGWFGDAGLRCVWGRGHALPPGGLANLTQEALGCNPGACRGPHDWKLSPAAFLNSSLLREQLRPDVVFLNTGLWKTIDPGAPLAELVAAAKDLHQTSSVEVFWKTTTSRAAGAVWVNDTVPREAFLHAGLKAFDASIFTLPLRSLPELYRDVTTHYVPAVYIGLNRLLLNELCPPETQQRAL